MEGKSFRHFLVLMSVVIGIVALVFFIPRTRIHEGASEAYKIVERIQRGKSLYGMKKQDVEYGSIEVIPIEYSKLEFVGSLLVGYKYGSDNLYLFTRDGQPLFEQCNIKNYKYYNNTRNNTYYHKIFAEGVYIIVEAEEGKGIVFIQEAFSQLQWVKAVAVGPYADIVPGCFGYMYKHETTQKWGYQVCYYLLRSQLEPALLQEDYNLLDPQYDEIIEQYNSFDLQNGLIFARKGEEWLAFNRNGMQVTYPAKVLKKILYLDPVPKMTSDPKFNQQRVGTKEASVAFVGY